MYLNDSGWVVLSAASDLGLHCLLGSTCPSAQGHNGTQQHTSRILGILCAFRIFMGCASKKSIFEQAQNAQIAIILCVRKMPSIDSGTVHVRLRETAASSGRRWLNIPKILVCIARMKSCNFLVRVSYRVLTLNALSNLVAVGICFY